MSERIFNALFLCSANSARSIMGESLLRHYGKGRFNTFSAGSHPKDKPHPMAIDLLRALDMPTDGLASKSWDVYAKFDAPKMDFVFTVCDTLAREKNPTWPGKPMTAHWAVFDPVAVEGSDMERADAFRRAYRELENRIKIFTSLRIEALSRMAIKEKLDEIGGGRRIEPAA